MADSTGDKSKPPFLAFVTTSADIDTLKSFAATHQWPEGGIQQGDIKTAAAFLKSNASPTLLVVEVPSAAEAPALFDALADVCDPDTKVIAVGNINEYSFYCWLMDLGLASYLLKPLTTQALEGAYLKSIEAAGAAKAGKPVGKVIAVIGARGGVGATTVALSMAGIVAGLTKKNVALVDIDPQMGSVALALDLEPSRGLRDALEKPDRIDALFIDRVMNKPLKNLSVLSAEESLNEHLNPNEHAAGTLVKELREKFDVVVLDIPRSLTPFGRLCLKQAGEVVLVSELTLLSLRDALRISDFMRESLKLKPPVFVANRAGLAASQEIPVADFEKGVSGKVAARVPFASDIFMQIGTEIPALKHKGHASVRPLYDLTALLVPEAKQKGQSKEKKSLSLFPLKKKR